MTISASSLRHKYNGNGVIRDWDFTFQISTTDGNDIALYKIDADGVITEITANYDVDVAAQHVTYPTVASGLPLLQTGEKIVLIREVSLSQLSDWTNQGPFNAEIVEAALDKLTMIVQQLNEKLGRAVLYSVDQEPTEEEITDFIATIEDLGDVEVAMLAAQAAQAAAELAQAAAAVSASAASASAAAAAASAASVPSVDTDGTLAANSDAKVASQKATKTYADTKLASAALDTDGTLAANSDSKVATQKATKTYVNGKKLSGFVAPDAAVSFDNQQATGLVLENRTNDTGCTQTGRIWFRTDL
jgi:hypothetical protein